MNRVSGGLWKALIREGGTVRFKEWFVRVEVMSRSQHMMDAVMIQDCTQTIGAKRVGATMRSAFLLRVLQEMDLIEDANEEEEQSRTEARLDRFGRKIGRS